MTYLMFFLFLRPLTVAAGHPLFEDSEKIQRCLSVASSFEFIIEKIAGRRTVFFRAKCFVGSFLGNAKKND